jgi:hypothetical protein
MKRIRFILVLVHCRGCRSDFGAGCSHGGYGEGFAIYVPFNGV